MRQRVGRVWSALLVVCMATGLGISGYIGRTGEGMGGSLIGAESERFGRYTDEMFLEEIAENTIDLHYTLAYPQNYGITDYEVTLGDYSLEEMKEREDWLTRFEEELNSFDVEKLTPEQVLTYDIMLDYVQTERSVEGLSLYGEVLGPTTGYQADLPVILAEYTFRTEQDVEDYLELAGQVDELFTSIIEFEKEKSDAGLFMPDYVADEVIDQCEEFLSVGEDNYMIEVFNDNIESVPGLDEEKKEAYRERNREVILGDVTDGFVLLIDGLKELKGSGRNDLGLCYYEDGEKYYEYLVRTETGSDDSVDELMDRTEAYIDGCMQQIYDTFRKRPELFDMLDDAVFPLTDPEEIMQDLIGKFGEEFPEPPEADYAIKYVHPSMEEHLSPAFYLMTPIDDTGNNVIYLNRWYLDAYMAADIYPTLAHEGYPGHLYQNLITASAELPLVRNLFGCSGYTEGWATYVEYYSYGISGMDEDLANILMWDSSSTLGLYAYVDMGVHYKGWDVPDVEEYLRGYGIRSKSMAQELFETMVGDPAGYLSYFIGYLEFLQLRQTAEDMLGDAFDAVEFHRFLLTTGPAPFYIIEKHMQDWMDNV